MWRFFILMLERFLFSGYVGYTTITTTTTTEAATNNRRQHYNVIREWCSVSFATKKKARLVLYGHIW